LELAALIRSLGIPVEVLTGAQFEDEEGRIIGPFNSSLYGTVIGEAIIKVATTFSSSSLTARTREVIILAVGGQWGSAFELYAHEKIASFFGIPNDAIASLAGGQSPVGLSGSDLVAAQFVQELVTTRRVSDQLFQAAQLAFGLAGVVDMVNLAGSYLGVSAVLNAFEVGGTPVTAGSPVLPPAPSAAPISYENGLGGRLPLIDLDQATPAQLELAAFMKSLGAPLEALTGAQYEDEQGRLIGPFNGYLYNTVIGTAIANVATKFSSSVLTAKTREIIILAVGGQWGSAYELYAHEKIAIFYGIPEAAIVSLSAGQAPSGLSGNDLTAALFVQELISTYKVSDELYHAAEAAFGQVGVVDMVNLVGTYLGVSILLNAFEVPAPATIVV
jgi:alkylhydroperoxidase family enzyme